jgi:hypothetical protein
LERLMSLRSIHPDGHGLAEDLPHQPLLKVPEILDLDPSAAIPLDPLADRVLDPTTHRLQGPRPHPFRVVPGPLVRRPRTPPATSGSK